MQEKFMNTVAGTKTCIECRNIVKIHPSAKKKITRNTKKDEPYYMVIESEYYYMIGYKMKSAYYCDTICKDCAETVSIALTKIRLVRSVKLL